MSYNIPNSVKYRNALISLNLIYVWMQALVHNCLAKKVSAAAIALSKIFKTSGPALKYLT